MAFTTVTSTQNPRVKAVVALRRGGRRDRAGRIVIDGRREIARAVESGVRIREVWCGAAQLSDADRAWINRLIAAGDADVIDAPDGVLEKIAYGERQEGLIAVADRPRRSLDGIALPENPLVGLVERVEKPGNLGAVLRSADAAGIHAIIAVDSASDVFGPNVIRASLGAVFTVPTVEATFEQTRAWATNRALQTVVARPDADRIYTDVDFRGPTAFVLGSEAEGVTDRWADAIACRVPMAGKVDSLNVSVTAALLFYEAVRQRRVAKTG